MAQESWQLNDPKMAPPPSLPSSPPSSPEVLPSPFIAADQLAGAQSPSSALAGDSFAPESAGQPYPVTSVDESPNAMSTSQFYVAATSADKSSISISASVGPSHASVLAGKPSAAELVGRLYSATSVGESSFPSPSLSSSLLQTQTALSSFSTTVAAPNMGGRGLRCLACRKRIGLAGFKCRCGGLFCPTHRYSDKHPCTFDYKAAGREAIAKANPLIKAIKITKI